MPMDNMSLFIFIQQLFNCAKAKRQQQWFNCAKAKRQQQLFYLCESGATATTNVIL